MKKDNFGEELRGGDYSLKNRGEIWGRGDEFRKREISNFEYMDELNKSSEEEEFENDHGEGSFLQAIDNCIQQLDSTSGRKETKAFNYEKKASFGKIQINSENPKKFKNNRSRQAVRSDLVNYEVNGSIIGVKSEHPRLRINEEKLMTNNAYITEDHESYLVTPNPFKTPMNPSMQTEEKEDLKEYVYDPNPHFYNPSSDSCQKESNYEEINCSSRDRGSKARMMTDDRESSSSNFTLINRCVSPPYHPSFYRDKDLRIILEENRQLRFLMSDYLKEIDQARFSCQKMKKKYSKVKIENKDLKTQIEDLNELVQILSQTHERNRQKSRKRRKGKRYRSQESLVRRGSDDNTLGGLEMKGGQIKNIASYTLGGSSPEEISPLTKNKNRAIISLKTSRKSLKVPFKDRLKMIRQNQDSMRSSLNLKITNNFLTLPQNHHHQNRLSTKLERKKPKLIFQKKNSKTQKILEKFEKKNFNNKISLDSFLSKNTRIKGLRSSLGFKKQFRSSSIFQSLGNEAMFKNLKERSKTKNRNSETKKFQKKKRLMTKFLKPKDKRPKGLKVARKGKPKASQKRELFNIQNYLN